MAADCRKKKERMSALTRRTVSFETSLTEMFSHYFSHLTIKIVTVHFTVKVK